MCQSCGWHSLPHEQLHSCQISKGDEILFAIILWHRWLIYGSYVRRKFEFPCLSYGWNMIVLLLPPMRPSQVFQAHVVFPGQGLVLLSLELASLAQPQLVKYPPVSLSLVVLIRFSGFISELNSSSSQVSEAFRWGIFSTLLFCSTIT